MIYDLMVILITDFEQVNSCSRCARSVQDYMAGEPTSHQPYASLASYQTHGRSGFHVDGDCICYFTLEELEVSVAIPITTIKQLMVEFPGHADLIYADR